MNNMPYPYMPFPMPTAQNFEEELNKLKYEVANLKERVKKLEKKKKKGYLKKEEGFYIV